MPSLETSMEIGIVSSREFTQNPQWYLRLVSGNFDTQGPIASNTLCPDTGDICDNELPEVAIVKNEEELNALKLQILGAPLFGEPVIELAGYDALNYNITQTGNNVFIVNTQHPTIADQLKAKFVIAENFLKEGKRFCIKVDFEPVLKEWFKSHTALGSASFFLSGAKFYITNFGAPQDFCCNACTGVLLSCYRIPCIRGLGMISLLLYFLPLLVIWPVYMIYRLVICNDDVLVVEAKVDGCFHVVPVQNTAGSMVPVQQIPGTVVPVQQTPGSMAQVQQTTGTVVPVQQGLVTTVPDIEITPMTMFS